MLTGEENVFLNYKKPNERPLYNITADEAQRYLDEGHFPPGSMGPKIQAAIHFLEWGGSFALITSLDKVREAFEGRSGTRIAKKAI
jgi:carbamate kinase